MPALVETEHLTIRDISKLCRVDYRTVQGWKASGRLPAPSRVVGRRPLWTREQVERFLDGAAAPATA